nr:2Fe-2S iron-sulfur cluster-binding protein [uncultured Steroidobacter sp.]
MLVEQDAALTLRVVDDDGERTIEAQAGRSLLKSLQDASVPVGSVCGGQMACGTCHVFVEPIGGGAQQVPSRDEITLLEYSRHYRPGVSRLACQVEVTPALCERRIVIAPED